MISYPSLASADPTWTLYFFENRMKKLLKDPKNFRDFSDEQMDILVFSRMSICSSLKSLKFLGSFNSFFIRFSKK